MPEREEGLPSDWKKKGFCSVKYTSHSATDACVALKYVDLADVAKVHCSGQFDMELTLFGPFNCVSQRLLSICLICYNGVRNVKLSQYVTFA